MMPIEPAATLWEMPAPERADDRGLVGVGADLEPGTILSAYRSGLFPMPVGAELGWWSPDPRAVIPLAGLQVSRSLAKSVRRYETTVNQRFADVITECAREDAGVDQGGVWITPEMRDAYTELHRLGWAHSIEVWHERSLVGGLYGLGIGGFFAGESMFHRRRDASKVALVRLVSEMHPEGLLDVQWQTDHLASLGAIEVPQAVYLSRLEEALRLPLPGVFA